MSKSEIAVSVRGLSKSYTIAHEQEKHITLAETMLARLKNPLKRAKTETFWALKDIDFDIKKGDVVGIIGRNGAGKSTLLKILSRITEPTSGKIELYGRVGSLLEVGTGFHPELTGRENVYLNGAILGMHRAEIKRQFDAIVDFSGVEKFLDTPVKRYSSGMYVRLAFAVAAHLNPEILIVDEVLAVGDSEFQKKCLGKMKDVSSQGRTVLFVSHNMGAVRQLCNKCIFLKNGSVQALGELADVVPMYFKAAEASTAVWIRPEKRPVPAQAYFRSVELLNSSGAPATHFPSDDTFTISVSLRVCERLKGSQIAVRVTDSESVPVFTTASTDSLRKLHDLEPGDWRLKFDLPRNLLRPGNYSLTIAVFRPGQVLFDSIDGEISFEVEDVGSHSTFLRDGRLGVVGPLIHWAVSSSLASEF